MGESWPAQDWLESHAVQGLADVCNRWPIFGVFLATGSHKIDYFLRSMARYHQVTSPSLASRLLQGADLQGVEIN